MNPNAAKLANRNVRFPLHIFLEVKESKCLDQFDRGILALALIDVAPEVLEVRDSKTGLFPFMLAAKENTPCYCHKCGNVESICECEIEELNLIYTMLLKNPSVIKNSLTKDYFKAEILKVERMMKELENRKKQLEEEVREMEEKVISKLPTSRKKIRLK